MTSTARFDNWQNRLGTQAGSIDASGNVTFDNDVTVSGGATVSGDLTVTGNMTSANQGLVFIKSQTIGSGVASVTVNDAFSSTFDNYKIVIAGSTGSTISAMEMTFPGKTAGYYGIRRITQYSTGADTNYSKVNASEWEVGSFQSVNDGTFCVIELSYPFSSTITTCYSSHGWGGGYMNRAAGDESSAAGSHTSFTIACNSGTFSGGTIRVYGYNNG